MTKYIVAATLGVVLLGSAGVDEAKAQGFHFGGHGIHVDVGYPHVGYGYYPHARYVGYGWGGWGGWGSHSWHDTTHLDYHPGGFVPHYDHYDYVPGHYRVHYDGHWDHHHF
jgi:hypothetical protein